MRLAISTLPCKDWTLEKTLQICRENGITGLEIRIGLNEWSKLDMNQEECDRILSALQKYDITITDLGTSVVVNRYDEGQLIEFNKCILLAKRLKTKGLRVMLGNFRDRWSESIPTIDVEGMTKWLKQADKWAEENDIEIWIETHNEFATGKSLQKLFNENHLTNCKVIWDLIHPLEQEEDFITTYEAIKEYLIHVHIKDGIPWEDKDMANWKYTPIMKGIVPIAKIVKLLEAKGYGGYYSLEWESLWRAEIRGESYTGEKIIPHYGKVMRELLDLRYICKGFF